MTPEQRAVWERLTPDAQAKLHKVARRIAEGYDGEIILHVKRDKREPAGRSGISFIKWVQTDYEGDV